MGPGCDITVFAERFVHQDFQGLSDFAFQLRGADLSLRLHEAVPALFFHFVGDMVRQIVCCGTVDILVFEATDAVQIRFLQPIQQDLKILFRLAWEADDKSGSDRDIRADVPPGLDAVQRLFLMGRPPHQAQNLWAAVLKRNVEIRENDAVGHQGNKPVHMRIWIDIMQADPSAERAQFARQRFDISAYFTTVPPASRVFQVGPIGRRVLADDQEFLDPSLHQPFRLIQHLRGWPACQFSAHRWDDAEFAGMIAAL